MSKIKQIREDIETLEKAKSTIDRIVSENRWRYLYDPTEHITEEIKRLNEKLKLPVGEIVFSDDVKIGDTLFINNGFKEVKSVCNHTHSINKNNYIIFTFDDNSIIYVGYENMVVRITDPRIR